LIILGIDPGTATTGFGIIEFDGYNYKLVDFGCIKTAAGLPLALRINQIVDDLKTIIEEFHPDEVCLEKIYFNKNVKTGISVAQARGALLSELSQRGYQPGEYNPVEVKMGVCGYGKANKDQIQKMVMLLLNLTSIPKPDDAADALAIAICHANSRKQPQYI